MIVYLTSFLGLPNKLSQAGGLRPPKFILLQFEGENSKIKVSSRPYSLCDSAQNPSLLLALGGASPASFQSVPLSSCVCVCVSLSLNKDTSHIGLQAHPLQCDLILSNYIFNNPVHK